MFFAWSCVGINKKKILCNLLFYTMQILWTFSIYLESVAILPQLFMISKTGEAETITSHYLFALGIYRALYILNWIYRYYFDGFFDLIAVVAGCVQTVLYCDFFYLYITKGDQPTSIFNYLVTRHFCQAYMTASGHLCGRKVMLSCFKMFGKPRFWACCWFLKLLKINCTF